MLNVVLLVVHLMIAVLMIAFILAQKTEGGGAGAGFSGSASVESMMRPRARPNPLGRATSILGFAFFVTSIGLALVASPRTGKAPSIVTAPVAGGSSVPKVADQPAAPAPAAPNAPAGAPAVPNQ